MEETRFSVKQASSNRGERVPMNVAAHAGKIIKSIVLSAERAARKEGSTED